MKNLTRIYESDLDFGIGARTLKVNKDAKEVETKNNKKDSQKQRRIIQNDILLLQQQHVSFNDKSPKADNLRRGWMRGFQAFLREQQLVVALESVGSKTMNRKMKSTLQGEFDGIPSRRDQPNKWAQHIQPPPAIQLENHSSEDPRK